MDGLAELLRNLHELPHWLSAPLLVVATFVSEDLTCVAAGLAVATDALPFLLATVAVGLGIWLGDLALYGLGRWLGAESLASGRLGRWIGPARVQACRAGFARNGDRWLWITRFLPGVRTPTYLLAGALRHEFRRFASATFFPVLVWTPLFVGAVCLSGEAALGWVDALGGASWLAALSLLAGWWLLTKLLMPLAARWLRRDGAEIDDGGRAA
jgi:membrane protein DedA with SNARE-associated domain